MAQAFRFDLVDLRLFLNIAELDSLSRGAERSNISLAAASTRIKNLELNLGVQLFNRTSRGVTLTAPGQTFLQHAASVLKQLDQLNVDLRQYTSGHKGQLRIGANVTSLAEIVPGAMRMFLSRHPGVAVDLLYYRSQDGIRALLEDAIDVALVAGPIREPAIEAVSLGEESTVLVTAPGHALADKPKVSFSEILNYELVGLGSASTRHPDYARMAKALRKPLNYRIHLNNFEDVCQIVSEGIGVAVIPRAVAMKYAKQVNLAIVPIAERWARQEIFLCLRTPRTLPDYVDELIELIQQSAFDTVTVPNMPDPPVLSLAS